MSRLLVLGLSLTLLTVQPLTAQSPRQEIEARLEQLLKRYPDADANRDGVLTPAEARAFREQAAQRRERRVAPTHADISYGPHERNRLDLYLAKSEKPTPLIVYIHGGGFVGGDKSSISRGLVEAANAAGISMAAIHYRFVTEAPFPAPQRDSARAIQFLRANADKWNFDPQRVAAYGGSAGAGISMWLGFHDDLADPENPDPVLRQSTRLCAIGSRGGQTTYDPNLIKEWIGGRAYQHPSITKCYDLESLDQITDPKLQPLYDEVSAITHLTADDPPIHMIYSEADEPLPEDARPGQGIHHPNFGKKLSEKMKQLKIENVYRHSQTFKGNLDRDMLEHFQRWFAETK